MLTIGIRGGQSALVTEHNTAKAVGSGALEVFSTPSMIALMEAAASASVAPFLDEGCGTVGTRVDVRHTAATPLGMTVRCESELTGIDGRRLVFSVAAYDDSGLIGEGTHERCIVQKSRFMDKALRKKEACRP